jgi:hydroxymethylglutaryl-CoA lyase
MDKMIEVVEIAPRDGYQILTEFVPTDLKKKVISGIAASGVRNIQVTSFVKAIPQMADAEDVAEWSLSHFPDINISGLGLNQKGMERAFATGLHEVNYVICLSEKHNLQNVRRTHEQSFSELGTIIREFPDKFIVLDIASAFGYYGDNVTTDGLLRFMERAYEAGVRAFNLCDSVGLSTPQLIRERVSSALAHYPDARFDIHIHDTRGMGMLCTLVAIECGVGRIQTTLGGLGGCPFAHGATGNTCTEDVVYMLERNGYRTGIDFEKLLGISKFQKSHIQGNYSGHHVDINLSAITVQ